MISILPQMDKQKTIDIISDKWSSLSEACKTSLYERSELVQRGRNDVLIREGQYADRSYFIVRGCARAFYLKDGRDVTDWFAFEHSFICSIVSYFSHTQSPHYIEVLEDALLLEIKKEDAEELMLRHHDFERLTSKVVLKTMLQLQQRVVSLQFQTAQQKYDDILMVYPDIDQRVPLTHIASYIGITLETLSRIRRPSR